MPRLFILKEGRYGHREACCCIQYKQVFINMIDLLATARRAYEWVTPLKLE